jgi:hypothetical protein
VSLEAEADIHKGRLHFLRNDLRSQGRRYKRAEDAGNSISG